MTKHLHALISVLLLAAQASAETKPNIVVIMADDIGVGDLSFYQSRLREEKPVVMTPNLDRLVAEGMRFSDAHSPGSLCAPTRFAMLTGNYSHRNYSYAVWSPCSKSGIIGNLATSAELARKGGYHTSFFGKWGLGGGWKTKKDADFTVMDGGALDHGFDYACELPQGIQSWPYAAYENKQWLKMGPDSVMATVSIEQSGYAYGHRVKGDPKNLAKTRKRYTGVGDSNWDPTRAGPLIAGKAVAYIERRAAEAPGKPFYMYFCSQAVHVPHTPPKALDGEPIAGSTPGPHGDMIRELDIQVGMIVKALRKTGAYDNTLLIFTSDNGGLTLDPAITKAGHDTSNGRRGHKGAIHEGGHRVPFIASWPGVIRPGTECHEPIVSHDVMPTIAALAGQPVTRDLVKDATSLLPLFSGQPAAERHRYLLHRGGKAPWYALREGDWKLIMASNKKGKEQDPTDVTPVELYNLRENPSEDETRNLVNHPEHGSRMKAMLKAHIRIFTTGESTIVPAGKR